MALFGYWIAAKWTGQSDGYLVSVPMQNDTPKVFSASHLDTVALESGFPLSTQDDELEEAKRIAFEALKKELD